MPVFLTALAVYVAILSVVSAPVLVVALKKGRRATARKFGITAGLTALLCAITATTSSLLVERCFAAGNTGCVDYGSSGIQIVLVAVYAIVSWSVALAIHRD